MSEKSAQEQGKSGQTPPTAKGRGERPAKSGAKPAKGTEKSGQPESPQPRGAGLAVALSILALVGAAAAGGGGYRLWQQLQASRGELAALKAQVADETSAVRTSLESRVDREVSQLAESSQQADRQLADAVNREIDALEQALADLRGRLGEERTGWTVAEVENLLRIAAQRLALAGDVQSALAALETADRRLADMADPAYLPVREAIAADLQALRNLSAADRAGAAAKLSGLIRSLGELPLAERLRPKAQGEAAAKESEPASPVSDWRAFLKELWADIRSLVTVRHREGGTPEPLLAPEQRDFLRQNVQLKLESARLALLSDDGEVYHSALNEAAEWIRRYYDGAAPAVEATLEALGRLDGVEVTPEMPDVSDALRRLREIRARLAEEPRGAVAAPESAS